VSSQYPLTTLSPSHRPRRMVHLQPLCIRQACLKPLGLRHPLTPLTLLMSRVITLRRLRDTTTRLLSTVSITALLHLDLPAAATTTPLPPATTLSKGNTFRRRLLQAADNTLLATVLLQLQQTRPSRTVRHTTSRTSMDMGSTSRASVDLTKLKRRLASSLDHLLLSLSQLPNTSTTPSLLLVNKMHSGSHRLRSGDPHSPSLRFLDRLNKRHALARRRLKSHLRTKHTASQVATPTLLIRTALAMRACRRPQLRTVPHAGEEMRSDTRLQTVWSRRPRLCSVVRGGRRVGMWRKVYMYMDSLKRNSKDVRYWQRKREVDLRGRRAKMY